MDKIVPVILSGGSGTRLWPLSRSMRPKQFINLVGDTSLFQKTVERVRTIPGVQPPLVVCNEEHRFMVAEQLQELGSGHSGIILEPVGRNTNPAITAAAIKLARDPQTSGATMLVLPADHLIDDAKAFSEAVSAAALLAQSGGLVTFGVNPTYAATGYGYIRVESDAALNGGTNGLKVEEFVEKPDADLAREYVESGEYFWNSGMFVFNVATFLDEQEALAPDTLSRVTAAVDGAAEDLDFFRLDAEPYAECKSISVDYAVMEKSANVTTVPLDAGWSDIGSWSSLWETGSKDKHGNVTRGDVWLESVANSYIHSENRMVSAIGVDDVVIVETHDGVMVASKNRDQDIKELVTRLQHASRSEAELHRKAFRPWGNYDCLDSGERFQVKRIMVKPGHGTSMQRHFHRHEHWIVVRGTAEVTCGDRTFVLSENQSTFIPLGEQHRLKNPGTVDLELIEVQSGAYLGEDDIERIDDEYGRS